MLTVHQDLEVITALPPDDRGPILTEKVDAMQQGLATSPSPVITKPLIWPSLTRTNGLFN